MPHQAVSGFTFLAPHLSWLELPKGVHTPTKQLRVTTTKSRGKKSNCPLVFADDYLSYTVTKKMKNSVRNLMKCEIYVRNTSFILGHLSKRPGVEELLRSVSNGKKTKPSLPEQFFLNWTDIMNCPGSKDKDTVSPEHLL